MKEEMTHRATLLAITALAIPWLVSSSSCKTTPDPVGFCVDVQATSDMNTYAGQPHVVALYIYPLTASQGFRRLSREDLLNGATPSGMLEPKPRMLTVGPGQILPISDSLPPQTAEVGLVADYYQGPGFAVGQRKVVVPAKCGLLGRKSITLAANGLELQE